MTLTLCISLPVEQVGLVGAPVDLTYKYEHVGSDPAALAALAAGQHPFLERLKKAARPAVVVGPGVLRRADREAVMKAVHELCGKAGERHEHMGLWAVVDCACVSLTLSICLCCCLVVPKGMAGGRPCSLSNPLHAAPY